MNSQPAPAAPVTTMVNDGNPRSSKRARPYLYEVDLVRVITALCVVGVHAAAFTVVYNQTSLGQDLHSAVVTALHYTREVFLTITAFVLTYGYAHRHYSLPKFWYKRAVGVLIPYVAWSFFYVWFSTPRDPFGSWLWAAVKHTIAGDASYQLYYILLSIEFYLALPVFLWLMARVERHPWKLLAGSFVVQLILMYLNFHYIQASAFAATHWGTLINDYGWRLLPFYQFYMVIGALAATYLDQVRAFILRHGWWVLATLGVGLGSLWLRYLYALRVERVGIEYATSVFQPSMVFYSASIALFLYWIGCRWARRGPDNERPSGAPPKGARFVAILSDASFGIYLVHAFILDRILTHVGPQLPATWPAAIRALSVWALAASLSAGISALMLYIPGLSRLVGRPCAWPQAVALLRSAGKTLMAAPRSIKAWVRGRFDGAADDSAISERPPVSNGRRHDGEGNGGHEHEHVPMSPPGPSSALLASGQQRPAHPATHEPTQRPKQPVGTQRSDGPSGQPSTR